MQVSSRFQQVATAVKFVAFLAVVVAALAVAHPGCHCRRRARTAASVAGLIVALQAVVITYGGWQSALYFSEEDRDPTRNIPRAMIGGVASVIVVYLLVNLALLSVLPIADLAQSTLPAADARADAHRRARRTDHHDPVARLSAADAERDPDDRHAHPVRDGTRRSAVAKRRLLSSAGGTPTVATLMTTAVAVVLITTGTFQRLVAITAFFLARQLRRLLPGADRAPAA